MKGLRRIQVRIPFTRIQLSGTSWGRLAHAAISWHPHIVGVNAHFSLKGWEFGLTGWRGMRDFHLGPMTFTYCHWDKTFGPLREAIGDFLAPAVRPAEQQQQ